MTLEFHKRVLLGWTIKRFVVKKELDTEGVIILSLEIKRVLK
jgi:hypothetical protein